MAERATPEGLELAKEKFRRFSSKQALADLAQVSRDTVQKFFAGKPIGVDSFRVICKTLELDWEEIAGLKGSESELTRSELPKPSDANALVQNLREQIQPYIQKRCGTMRVLDMEQAIGLDSIYTRVNILEKLTRNRRRAITDLLDRYESEEFDRFVLSRVEERRVPGLEAAARHSKLLILGKPGAGKTTFLKWVALQSMAGQFCNDLVPVFVTLKAFAEAPKQPTLLNYIQEQF